MLHIKGKITNFIKKGKIFVIFRCHHDDTKIRVPINVIKSSLRISCFFFFNIYSLRSPPPGNASKTFPDGPKFRGELADGFSGEILYMLGYLLNITTLVILVPVIVKSKPLRHPNSIKFLDPESQPSGPILLIFELLCIYVQHQFNMFTLCCYNNITYCYHVVIMVIIIITMRSVDIVHRNRTHRKR